MKISVTENISETFHVSVRSLVEQLLTSGDLFFEFRGRTSPTEAIRAHQKIQAQRPPEYVREVPVKKEIAAEKFVLKIGGRIDGVYTCPDRVIVEEIKTTTSDPEGYERLGDPVHWGQLKVYAYLYAEKHGLDRIEGRLLYHCLNSGRQKQLDRSFSFSELKGFFEVLIDSYLARAAVLVEWRSVRDASLRKMGFPFADFRPGQRRMAVEVFRAVRNQGQLMVQAPTGIGKTLAVIFPALKALSERHISSLFYLTARNTVLAAAEKALKQLASQGARFKTLVLTAKEKICFNPHKACLGNECLYARGYFDRRWSAVDAAFQNDFIGRSVIEAQARQHEVCPFELAMELTLRADVILGDYNYAFDPQVGLRRFFTEPGCRCALLVDEAHNLVDRAREMYSAQIKRRQFAEAKENWPEPRAELQRALEDLDRWFQEKQALGAGNRAEYEVPEDLTGLLEDLVRLIEEELARASYPSSPEHLWPLYLDLLRFLRAAGRFDETYTVCFEESADDFKVSLFCVDPAPQLRNVLKKSQSAVFFSATMNPARYFKDSFGLDGDTAVLSLPSPFPPENLCLLVADRISTVYRRRRQTSQQVSQSLLAMIEEARGNYLFFFPSYAYLHLIRQEITGLDPGAEVIVQRPDMSDLERSEFLNRFNTDNPGSLIGLAVLGGIFGEGIDLKGERLTGVGIVGVGLPGLCLERESIRSHYNRKHGHGFEYAYLYPGMNRVLQAAGRLIRSETDRGVVLLIDERFSRPAYQSLFPFEWRPIIVHRRDNMLTLLNKFWRSPI